jgi:hypothetical protein
MIRRQFGNSVKDVSLQKNCVLHEKLCNFCQFLNILTDHPKKLSSLRFNRKDDT